jgi:integrase
MFLSKSTHGVWYVYYVGGDGKTKSKTTRCTIKSDALKFLQTFKTDEHKKRTETKIVLLQSFTTDFLAFANGTFSKGTANIYRASLNKLLSIIGNIPIVSITPQHYDKYKMERLNSPLERDETRTVSPVTVNIELRTLRAAFSTAVRWGVMQSNPFSRQKLVPVPESSPIFFSKEDFQKLLNTITEGWLKEIIIFATLTGLRRGEILNLHWSDVDLSRKTITIQSSPTFKTKNGKKRIVPLNDTAFYILQSKANKNLSALVFTLNDKPIFADWLSHKFKWYVYECNFREARLHFHSLRHTFASWLVQDGVSIYAVKELLGHADVKTTQVYSHLRSEQLHKEVNLLQISMN